MSEISVIVPVYKVEPYLCRCVDSILAQTFTDFELILVDDGSPDNCGAICDEYARQDDRIKVIHQKNQGVSVARNIGMEKACGEYITFVDSDDYVETDYIENLMGSPSDLTICGIETQNEQGRRLGTSRCDNITFAEKEEIDYGKLYKENMLYSPYCKLLRRQIIIDNGIRFPISINWGEDGMFIADYLQYVTSVKCIDYTGYRYIRYSNKETLSCAIHADSIDTIALTRGYCIERMKGTSIRYYEVVSSVIHEDICLNCKYVLLALFQSTKLKEREKITLLERYLKNQFVKEILCHLNVFFENQIDMQTVLAQNSTVQMVRVYSQLYRKKQLFEWFYRHCYETMPEEIKRLYRWIKRLLKQ